MKPLFTALLITGGLAFAGAGRTEDKKTEAKGNLTIDGKTYKLESALAYETKKNDKKRTVIYLSEKPLDTDKLKASFKKNGNDEDFFPIAPHVRLVFDDKGDLFQITFYAKGANIGLQGDPNIKAEATVKDGSAKGTAKSVKPDKDYEFDATFEVKLTKP